MTSERVAKRLTTGWWWRAISALVHAIGLTIDATPATAQTPAPPVLLVGRSLEGRPIHAHQFGDGPIRRVLVGGIHGGYELNTVRLMSRTVEHLSANPGDVPPEITLYVIPNMNPDGSVRGPSAERGRPNARGVDLNRNWDYAWQPQGRHGTRIVSAGSKPFSEPETAAVRDFIAKQDISAAVFYHSAFNAVFNGHGITDTQTVELAIVMAQATGYRHRPDGVPGQLTTGDAIDYLTVTAGVTAVEIELRTRNDIEWRQNLAGIRAFLRWNLP